MKEGGCAGVGAREGETVEMICNLLITIVVVVYLSTLSWTANIAIYCKFYSRTDKVRILELSEKHHTDSSMYYRDMKVKICGTEKIRQYRIPFYIENNQVKRMVAIYLTEDGDEGQYGFTFHSLN